jgi:hypothetical protein
VSKNGNKRGILAEIINSPENTPIVVGLIALAMLLQFADDVRQEMHGGTMNGLPVDTLRVPHRAQYGQRLIGEVDAFPLQPAQLCQRQTRPSGNHYGATCAAIHGGSDNLYFFERVRPLLPFAFGNLYARAQVHVSFA